MLVRGPSLTESMSRYLIDRIEAAENIEVLTNTEVVALSGSREKQLDCVRWRAPWRCREMLPESVTSQSVRPMRSENRALLVASIARGRGWLDELITDPAASVESIAARESCSVRKVNMTISLAFLAPDLVKAAIAGRLPHGMGVARLCDLPAEWSRQRQMLGLSSP